MAESFLVEHYLFVTLPTVTGMAESFLVEHYPFVTLPTVMGIAETFLVEHYSFVTLPTVTGTAETFLVEHYSFVSYIARSNGNGVEQKVLSFFWEHYPPSPSKAGWVLWKRDYNWFFLERYLFLDLVTLYCNFSYSNVRYFMPQLFLFVALFHFFCSNWTILLM